MNKTLCCFLTLFLVCACSSVKEVSEDEQHLIEQKGKPARIQTKAFLDHPAKDSLERVRRVQSDPAVILSKQVVADENGVFSLQISREDALAIGIPEEVYIQFVEYVDKLNEIKE